MKHFANYIDIYPESVVSTINTTTGVVTTSDASEPDRIYSFTNVNVPETPGTQNGNIYYQQNARIVSSEKLSDTLRSKYGNNRPVVVVLYDDQGDKTIWGDKTEKARVLIAPNLESDVLSISRKSINPLL